LRTPIPGKGVTSTFTPSTIAAGGRA
jgi:hypothetical protein